MSNGSAISMGATSEDAPSLTASAIVAPAVSGSHILRIEGYSRTKGLGNGKFITSETFSIGGHRWHLKYYPDSRDSKDSDLISIFLHLDHAADRKEVRAIFTISLLDQDGNKVPSYSKSSMLYCSFSAGRQGTMGYDLIKRSELEGSAAYLKDDAFSVRCDVTVAKEIFTKAIPVTGVGRSGVVEQEQKEGVVEQEQKEATSPPVGNGV
jgi:speckle-type POZ protein